MTRIPRVARFAISVVVVAAAAPFAALAQGRCIRAYNTHDTRLNLAIAVNPRRPGIK